MWFLWFLFEAIALIGFTFLIYYIWLIQNIESSNNSENHQTNNNFGRSDQWQNYSSDQLDTGENDSWIEQRRYGREFDTEPTYNGEPSNFERNQRENSEERPKTSVWEQIKYFENFIFLGFYFSYFVIFSQIIFWAKFYTIHI